MDEALATILSAVAFFLTLGVAILLWVVAWRARRLRLLWGLLAAGWTANFVGNLAWGLYEVAGDSVSASLSWLDAIYLFRYLLVGLAFWLSPKPWPWRRNLEVVLVAAVLTVTLGLAYYRPLLAVAEGSWLDALGFLVYPILDGAIAYGAWLRRQHIPAELRGVLLCLLVAMLLYGVANWINLNVHARTLGLVKDLANLGWFLADVSTVVGAVWFWRRERTRA